MPPYLCPCIGSVVVELWMCGARSLDPLGLLMYLGLRIELHWLVFLKYYLAHL